MGRLQIHDPDRFRNRFWAHALRAQYVRSMPGLDDAGQATKHRASWTRFGLALIGSKWPGADEMQPRAQGLVGIANKGADPYQFRIRVPRDEISGALPEGARLVRRVPTGKPIADEPREGPIPYMELTIDLVARGEVLCPGSSAWIDAELWHLARPCLPSLEQVRTLVAALLKRLKLCAPRSHDHDAALNEEVARSRRQTGSKHVERYRASMKSLVKEITPASVSLLAALTAESFITDNEVLLDIHRDSFVQAVEKIFEEELMADIQPEFVKLIAQRIVGLGWQLPTSQHRSSLKAPIISLDHWKAITGTAHPHTERGPPSASTAEAERNAFLPDITGMRGGPTRT
jgi:hypothetical protein